MDDSICAVPYHEMSCKDRTDLIIEGKYRQESIGDIQQLADLDMYCAAATAACNLEYVYHGHTVLEYPTGEVPRTHRDMVTPVDVPGILGDMDESFLQDLRDLLVEKHGLLEILRDDDARYSSLSRDAASSRRHVTSCSLRPGDKVSYEGQLYTLLSLDASTPSEPAKATIRVTTHDDAATRVVRYSALRPTANTDE